MLPGPIFRVELISIARRRRYFVLRVLYAALILFVLWATYSSSRIYAYGANQQSIRQSATLAATFFMSFSWLQMLAIMSVGPAMAVGTIATERERRTIEYLFVTDLSNAEIVLGKTFARLTLMAQFVLVGLPILFLFRLMGGIPAEALLATFLAAAGTAIMLTGLSIAVSVWTPKARDATVRIYLLLIAMFSLPLVLYSFQQIGIIPDGVSQLTTRLADGLLLINPLSTLTRAMGNASAIGFGLDMSHVMKSVGSQILVGVASLLLAMSAVRRVHLSETTRSAVKKSRYEIKSLRRPLGKNPMLWKEMYSSTSKNSLGRIGWGALLVLLFSIGVATLWMFISSIGATFGGQRDNYFEFLAGLTGYLGSGMLLLLAARSAGLIAQEKERDCWISLLSTPLTGQEIIAGKLWGNLYSARGMVIILCAAWGLGLFLTPTAIFPMVATCLTFLLLAFYVTCLGLFFSLRSPTTLRAMGQTLGTLVFFGGGYLFCCCVVMASGGGGQGAEIILFLCIPLLLCYPAIGYMMYDKNYWTEGGITAAYIIGLICYIVATGCLYGYLVSQFDEIAGRTKTQPDEYNPFAPRA
jgi:ABC-type transport system involved in multi-copper enzyme maturation permease subunit